MKAEYTNKLTGETYRLGMESGATLEKAWKRFDWVCKRNGWNSEDVAHITVTIS